VSVDAREEWDRIFSRLDKTPGGEDAWLERWRDLLEADIDAPVLDLGCGAGEDAQCLTRWGFEVVAADFSEKALELTSRRAPEAETKRVDLTDGLPFPDAHFGAIVASLSLHYFPWLETVEILADVRRCLVPGGHLLARLNSKNDAYYAAAPKEEIEPNFHLVNGFPKRLFDRDDVIALFSPDWKIEDAGERTTGRYGDEKTPWEIVAAKLLKPDGEAVSRRKPRSGTLAPLGDQLPAHDEAVLESGDRDAGLERDDGPVLDGVRHPGVVGLDGHPIVDLESVPASVGALQEDLVPRRERAEVVEGAWHPGPGKAEGVARYKGVGPLFPRQAALLHPQQTLAVELRLPEARRHRNVLQAELWHRERHVLGGGLARRVRGGSLRAPGSFAEEDAGVLYLLGAELDRRRLLLGPDGQGEEAKRRQGGHEEHRFPTAEHPSGV